MVHHTVTDSPLGRLTLIGDGDALLGLYYPGHRPAPAQPLGPCEPSALAAVRRQLEEYFAGQRTSFDVPIRPSGSRFQQAVWARMSAIGFGETRTYAQLAGELAAADYPRAHPRAVGHASARNPISIVIPCHRMIGSSGALTGYAGGVDRKRALLLHERAQAGSRSRWTERQQSGSGRHGDGPPGPASPSTARASSW